jgi:hypothetical protein
MIKSSFPPFLRPPTSFQGHRNEISNPPGLNFMTWGRLDKEAAFEFGLLLEPWNSASPVMEKVRSTKLTFKGDKPKKRKRKERDEGGEKEDDGGDPQGLWLYTIF